MINIEIGGAGAGKVLKTRSRESEVKYRQWWQDFSKQIVYGYRERTLVQKLFSRLQSVVTKTIELKPGSCSLAHLACVCVRTQCLVVLQSPR